MRCNFRKIICSQFVIHILKRQNRSRDQIVFLKRAFQDLKFFREKSFMLNEGLFHLLFKEIQYCFFNRSDVIFHYGQPGDIYYIILKGSVAILTPRIDNLTYDEQALTSFEVNLQQFNRIKNKTRRESLFLKRCDSSEFTDNATRKKSIFADQALQKIPLKDIIKAQALSKFFNAELNAQKLQNEDKNTFLEAYQLKQLESFNLEKQQREFLKICFPNYKIVNVLSAGEGFGEIALITNQNRQKCLSLFYKRTATIVCMEDSHFMTLDKEAFQNIVERYRIQIQSEKIISLKNFPLFQNLSNNLLHQFIEFMAVARPKMFEVIYLENQSADFMYIIKSGQVEIDQLSFVELELPNDYDKVRIQATSKKQKRCRISLALLQQGFTFGHEDILQNKNRSSRAIVKSNNCELFLVPAKVKSIIFNHQIVRSTVKNSNISKLLESSKYFQEIHDKSIKISNQLFHQSKAHQNLSKYLQTNLPVTVNDQKQPMLIQSGKSPEQLPSFVDFYRKDFEHDYEYVSRMKMTAQSSVLNENKKQILEKSHRLSTEGQPFQPLFTSDYFHNNFSSSRISRNLQVKSKSTQFHKEIDFDKTIKPKTSHEKARKLFSQVFRGHTESRLTDEIFQPSTISPFVSCWSPQEINQIDLGVKVENIKKMSHQTSKSEIVNIHTHLFSPKVAQRTVKIRKTSIQT